MSKDICEKVLIDIKDREQWAERQAVFYQMRHDGIRRKSKPYPGATDLHFPLVDGTIEKLKPFYQNQMFATETVAAFVGKPDVDPQAMTDLAYWFDYKVKQKSNFEDEIILAIDYMLSSGRGPIKITWDAVEKCLRYEAIEPLYFVVPKATSDLKGGFRVTHIMHLTREDYTTGRMSEVYNQTEETVNRIIGGQSDDGTQSTTFKERERSREGLDFSDNPDTIILWETYVKEKAGWRIYTYSPQAPELEIRKDFVLPYKHGELPFVAGQMERKQRGYYSSRGISEIAAPFEVSLCKSWNEKHDAMTFFNRPLLSSENQIPNGANLGWQPGMIIPFKVQRVDMGRPPMDFDTEMANTRAIAEGRIAMPDFGIGGQAQPQKGQKTATEVDAISNLSSQVIDGRSRLFRRTLAGLWRQSFELLKQYDQDFQFISKGKQGSVKADLLHSVLSIEPSGTSQSWDTVGRLQKAVARKQMFTGDPFINQLELDKSVLELDEPGLVDRLIQDPSLPQKQQMKRQEMEIPALMLGMPVPVTPDDDDAVHLMTLTQFRASLQQRGVPFDPMVGQVIDQHANDHLAQLQQKDPQAARAVMAQIKQLQAQVTQFQQPQEVAA